MKTSFSPTTEGHLRGLNTMPATPIKTIPAKKGLMLASREVISRLTH